jgi:hypothetical protein
MANSPKRSPCTPRASQRYCVLSRRFRALPGLGQPRWRVDGESRDWTRSLLYEAAAAVRPTPPGNNRRLRLGFSACWLGGAGMPLLLAWLTGVAALLAPRTVLVTVTWLLPAVRRGNVRALFLTGPSISHSRYLLSRCWAGYVGRPPPLDVEIQVRSPLGQKGGAARPHARRLRHQATRSTARLAWRWSRTASARGRASSVDGSSPVSRCKAGPAHGQGEPCSQGPVRSRSLGVARPTT